MLNKVILIGRLTRDPVLRGANGTQVANFTVAVDRASKGEKHADFIDIVAWGKLADWCKRWTGKGMLVIVVGSIQTRGWEDRYGNKRVAFEVRADEVKFGETKAARERAGNTPSAAPANPPGPDGFTDVTDEDDENDVPF